METIFGLLLLFLGVGLFTRKFDNWTRLLLSALILGMLLLGYLIPTSAPPTNGPIDSPNGPVGSP